MATKHSRTKKKPVSNSARNSQSPTSDSAGLVHLTEAGLRSVRKQAFAEATRELIAQIARPSPKSERELELERIEREGFTIPADRLRQARNTVDDLTFTMRAIHHLAWEAEGADAAERESLLTAARHSSVMASRYCDLLRQLLGRRSEGSLLDDRFTLAVDPKQEAAGQSAAKEA